MLAMKGRSSLLGHGVRTPRRLTSLFSTAGAPLPLLRTDAYFIAALVPCPALGSARPLPLGRLCSSLHSALQSRCISNLSLRGLDSPVGRVILGISPLRSFLDPIHLPHLPWPFPGPLLHPEIEASARRSHVRAIPTSLPLPPLPTGRSGPALACPLSLAGDWAGPSYLLLFEGAQPRHPSTCAQIHPLHSLTHASRGRGARGINIFPEESPPRNSLFLALRPTPTLEQ